MSGENHHLIRKQILELSAASLPAAQWWEQQSGPLLEELISPCLQNCFDRAEGQGEHIIIDRLEIDLGTITRNDYTQLVPERLNAALDSALRRLKPLPDTHLNNSHTRWDEDWRPPSAGQNMGQQNMSPEPTAAQHQPDPETAPPQRLSPQQAPLEAFVFYLRHGLLPWWFERSSDKRPPWNRQWFVELNPSQLQQIVETLKTPLAARRLIYCFDDLVIGRIVSASLELGPEEPSAICSSLLPRPTAEGQLEQELRTNFWQVWVQLAITSSDKAQCINRLCDFILHQAPLARAAEQLSHAEAGLTHAISTQGFLPQLLAELTRRLPGTGSEPTVHTGASETDNSTDRPTTPTASAASQPPITEPYLDFDADKASALAEEMLQQGMFVDCAGIVLLHPFLPELFEDCGLWSKHGWCKPTAAQEAIQILNWLASGDTAQPEYRLALQKVLCGIQVNQPVSNAIAVTTQQQDSCLSLLKAAVRHWGALGNTSPDGLREGFIDREGLLQKREQGWRLNIEKKAQDILLSKLPWGVSLIQLPWMERQRIYVDWI